MKLSSEQSSIVAENFKNLQGKKDFLKVLNLTKTLMYGDDCKPVLLKSVTWYANPNLSVENRYRTFSIPKKSGKSRTIHAPVDGLKSILKILNTILECVSEPHIRATGFVSGKSIVDNAKIHINKQYVYNTDLKNFFHSFDRNRVKMGFWYHFFQMKKDKEPIAFLLASLCTHPININGKTKTVLPQGSPTSPIITNILCKKLDRRLSGLAKKFNIQYSRYADDITFSADYDIFSQGKFQYELTRIVCIDQKLEFNKKKTRLQKTGYRQEVTGLIVNEKVNVRRSYLKEIRMYLHYWEKYGYEKANQIYQKDLSYSQNSLAKPQLKNMIDGKLEFLKMVKGKKDNTYLTLTDRRQKLEKSSSKISESNLEQIVDTILNKGLDAGLSEYITQNQMVE